MTEQEREGYERDGFVIRRSVFDEDDLDELRTAAEEVITQIVAHRQGRRMPAGTYTFELARMSETIIKWEGDTDVVHGIEPFAHLHPTFVKYGEDPRFTALAKDIIGLEELSVFTEKLNYKRAHQGGRVALHQDHPYWVDSADDIDHMVTIMLLLDDSDESNGCLEVVPGSHKWGVQEGRHVDDFGKFEMDDEVFDLSQLRPVPLAAGDFVAFGADLVHWSRPNTSDTDRRALLYTYQPAGLRNTLDNLRKLTGARSS
jgi:ectoine hydroxylase-related dioxygenase (phytanoyl-CoA dioxygenase family)